MIMQVSGYLDYEYHDQPTPCSIRLLRLRRCHRCMFCNVLQVTLEISNIGANPIYQRSLINGANPLPRVLTTHPSVKTVEAPKKIIIYDGKKLHLGECLYDALYHLQGRYPGAESWVDAIYITWNSRRRLEEYF